MAGFTHLHVHTQYSILDGASSIPLLIEKARNDDMSAVAITDHGNLFGCKEFHNEAKIQGLKPILGCEVYVAKNSRFDHSVKDDRSGYHLILLAKNQQGFKNLMRLVSLAWLEGHYYKPRIDKELLTNYHEGLIVSTACLGGEIPSLILNGPDDQLDEAINYFKSLFRNDFYFELQRHPTGDPVMDSDTLAKQKIVNARLLELSRKYKIKVIATNDVHFIQAEDAEAHDRLICLNTGKDLDDLTRLRYTKQEWFKTTAEMQELFADIPEALENTAEIVDKIEQYELNHDPIMPDFPIPEGFADADDYLRHLTYQGAQERYPELTTDLSKRIDYELGVIRDMGFPGYFLIVQDFLRAAREMGVSVGPGRGSAAGSVVAYCTRITDIDPIRYNLLFERFLTSDRISLPDIDIDFDEDGRDEVLKYVVNKYGSSRVAHIITFGTMAARMAIRDVARIEKLPLSEADRLAKLVPERPGIPLRKAYLEVPELEEMKRSGNDQVKNTLKFAEILEGSVRHTGLHACGIIIGRDDLIDHIPLCKSKDTELLVTQLDGDHVESLGMLKMDFLGLKTLSIIKDTVELVYESRGIKIDINSLPLDDKNTYQLYSQGATTGLFQFESPGMKRFLRVLKPNRFEDLIAMNALYRPGPMEYIDRFINRKHGREKIHYELPLMEEYLKDTYGITVYQEQVMLLSQAMAGFSGSQADALRKAMGKKKRKMMDELKEKFLVGCHDNNIKASIAQKVWADWEAFAHYAFNKSHSTCYAYVSYQTAYLKANYPAEFMASVLSRNVSDIKKITQFMNECRRMGLPVLGPDINESRIKFAVNPKGEIRFGLGAIKGLGEAAASCILEERLANGPYKNIFDFVERVDLQAVNKKSLESLAACGALDNFTELKRGHYFADDGKGNIFIEHLIRYGHKIQDDKNASQQSLFSEAASLTVTRPDLPAGEDWPTHYKLDKEKELIGIYLTAHPLDTFKFEIDHFCTLELSELTDLTKFKGREVVISGLVRSHKQGITKNNKPFGTIFIEDFTDSYRLVLFNMDNINFQKFFVPGYALLIKASIKPKGFGPNPDEPELKIQHITMLANVREELINSITLYIQLSSLTKAMVSELSTLIHNDTGKTLLKVIIEDQDENIRLDMFSRNNRITVSDNFINFLLKHPEIEYKLN
jgi:DNA polymerase-3 subunit alpha